MSTWRLFPTDGLFEAGDVFLSFPGPRCEVVHPSSRLYWRRFISVRVCLESLESIDESTDRWIVEKQTI